MTPKEQAAAILTKFCFKDTPLTRALAAEIERLCERVTTAERHAGDLFLQREDWKVEHIGKERVTMNLKDTLENIEWIEYGRVSVGILDGRLRAIINPSPEGASLESYQLQFMDNVFISKEGAKEYAKTLSICKKHDAVKCYECESEENV